MAIIIMFTCLGVNKLVVVYIQLVVCKQTKVSDVSHVDVGGGDVDPIIICVLC